MRENGGPQLTILAFLLAMISGKSKNCLRSSFVHCVTPTLLLLAIGWGLNAMSDWQFRQALTQHALYEIGRHIQDKRWWWSFDGDTLLSGTINQLDNIEDGNGVLSFTTTDVDPYFAVNQRGDFIASRYCIMKLEIESSAATEMQLYFESTTEADDVINASALIPVAAGKNSLSIALDEMVWHAIPGTNAQVPWGGEVRAVRLLRIDPAAQAGVKMHITHLSLSPRQPNYLAASGADSLPRKQLFEVMSRFDWHSVDRTRPFDTQLIKMLTAKAQNGSMLIVDEQSEFLWQQQKRSEYLQLKRSVPDAIIMPDAETTLKRLTVNDLPSAPVHWPMLTWRNSVYVTALLVSGLLIWLLFFSHRQLSGTGWPVIVELFGLLTLVWCTWWIGCHDKRAALALTVPALLMTCIHLARQQKGSTRMIMGLSRPTRQMWYETAALSLLLLAIWAGGYLAGPRTTPIEWKSVWTGLLFYPLWGILQQFFMGPLIAASLARIAGGSTASYAYCAIITASFFSLLHFPNQQLMLVTLVVGAPWSWLYLRHRSIIPIGISHGILGTVYFQLSPDFMQADGNVGMKYLDWLY